MPEFEYTALDANGNAVRGTVSASTMDEARQRLADQGLEVSQCSEIVTAQLSEAEAMSAARYVSEIILAGLPLASGLQAVSDELARHRRNLPLSHAIGDMARRLESGESVDAALASTSQQFPAPWQGVIEAGVSSGRLQDTLAWFVDTQRSKRRLRRQLTLAIGYPIAILAVVLVLNIGLSVFVLPQYVQIVNDFGAELPAPTYFVIFFGTYGWQIVLGLIGLVFVCTALVALIGGLAAVHRVIHFIPVVGRIYFGSGLSALSSMLSLLLKQGVALPDAMRMAGQALGDRALGEACYIAADDVAAGKRLSTALGERYCLLQGLAPVVQWGEDHGTLPSVLDYVGQNCDGWADFQTDYLKTIVPPFTFLFILWAVALTVSGLFLPMIKLMQTLT